MGLIPVSRGQRVAGAVARMSAPQQQSSVIYTPLQTSGPQTFQGRAPPCPCPGPPTLTRAVSGLVAPAGSGGRETWTGVRGSRLGAGLVARVQGWEWDCRPRWEADRGKGAKAGATAWGGAGI